MSAHFRDKQRPLAFPEYVSLGGYTGNNGGVHSSCFWLQPQVEAVPMRHPRTLFFSFSVDASAESIPSAHFSAQSSFVRGPPSLFLTECTAAVGYLVSSCQFCSTYRTLAHVAVFRGDAGWCVLLGSNGFGKVFLTSCCPCMPGQFVVAFAKTWIDARLLAFPNGAPPHSFAKKSISRSRVPRAHLQGAYLGIGLRRQG